MNCELFGDHFYLSQVNYHQFLYICRKIMNHETARVDVFSLFVDIDQLYAHLFAQAVLGLGNMAKSIHIFFPSY